MTKNNEMLKKEIMFTASKLFKKTATAENLKTYRDECFEFCKSIGVEKVLDFGNFTAEELACLYEKHNVRFGVMQIIEDIIKTKKIEMAVPLYQSV